MVVTWERSYVAWIDFQQNQLVGLVAAAEEATVLRQVVFRAEVQTVRAGYVTVVVNHFFGYNIARSVVLGFAVEVEEVATNDLVRQNIAFCGQRQFVHGDELEEVTCGDVVRVVGSFDHEFLVDSDCLFVLLLPCFTNLRCEDRYDWQTATVGSGEDHFVRVGVYGQHAVGYSSQTLSNETHIGTVDDQIECFFFVAGHAQRNNTLEQLWFFLGFDFQDFTAFYEDSGKVVKHIIDFGH
ncbi:hypothetical protein D3C75_474310 [compost metagenome]